MFSGKSENGKEKLSAGASAINLIGEGTRIKGDMHSTGDVRIDGQLKGTIKSNSKVVIGPKGVVEGDIICDNADISGTIRGSLTVKELLFLKGTANIEGDMMSAKLVVESGAKFNGTCRMGVTKEMNHEEEIPTKLKKSLV